MIFAGALLHLTVVLLPYALCRGSFEDPATLALAVGATALYLGDAKTMRWSHAPSRSPIDASAHRWAAATGLALLAILWSSLVARAVTGPPASWLQLAGAGFLACGVALRACAIQRLGPRFRTEIDGVDGALERRGVYRCLRHPSEAGLLLAALGAPVLLQSLVGLLLWVGALVPITLYRLRLEERLLAKRFGSEYQCYRAEVGGLVPRWPRVEKRETAGTSGNADAHVA